MKIRSNSFNYLLLLLLTFVGLDSFGQTSQARDTVEGIIFQFELEDRLTALNENFNTIKTHEDLEEPKEELDDVAFTFKLISDDGEIEKKHKNFEVYSWLDAYRIRLEATQGKFDSIRTHINRTVPLDLDKKIHLDLDWNLRQDFQKNSKKEQKAYDNMYTLQTEVLKISKNVVYSMDTSNFTPEEVKTFDEWLNSVGKWEKIRRKEFTQDGYITEIPVTVNLRRRTIENEKGKRVEYWSFNGLDFKDHHVVKKLDYEIVRDAKTSRDGVRETLVIRFDIKRFSFEYEGNSIPEASISIEWKLHLNTLENGTTYTRFDLSPEAIEQYPLGKVKIGKGEFYNSHDILHLRSSYYGPHVKPYLVLEEEIYE